MRIQQHCTQARRFLVLLTAWLLLLVTACNQAPVPTPTLAPVTPASATGTSTDAAATQQTGQPPAQSVSSTPTVAPTPALPLTVEGRLVLWHSWTGADADALATMLLALQSRYPALQVDTLFVTYNDLPQSYAEAVQGGGGPDLVLTSNWWLGDMVAAGVVQPLDALLPAAVLESYWPATLDSLRWEDQLYGLPTNFELISLFYNRSLIAPEQLPATTTDLLALAEANPAQGIGLYASLYHLYWGFPAFGAQWFDENGRVILDQGTGAADYLTWLALLNNVNGSFVDSDYGMLLDRFKKGEFAFLVDGPWSIADLQGALGEDLAVAPLPAGQIAAAQPWLSADGLFINPRIAAEQQQLALVVAQSLTDVESGTTLATRAQRLPANRGVQLSDPLLQGFLQQAATAQALPMIPEMTEAWGYGGDLLLRVLDGSEDPTQAVAETATLINEANGK
ncbi:MAG: extracellular solute-binding protein [Caldilineaceae bacterium]|nr:extracellular solute-binding protein [Caldilineaceae bacterium]